MIFVECNLDKIFLKKLGLKEIHHCSGKGKVLKTLEKLEKNSYGKAMIDEDPGSPSAHPSMQKLKKREERCGFKVLVDDCQNNIVVVLSPRLEEWLLKCARDANVEPGKYEIPDDGNQFHKVCSLNPDRKNVHDFLEALIKQSDCVKELRRILG